MTVLRQQYSSCSVVESVPRDVAELAPVLRQCDQDELRYWGSGPASQALLDSLTNAKVCLSLKDQSANTVAMFGVGWTDNPRLGKIWILSSDYLQKIPRLFLRESPKFTQYFMQGHDVLFNHVHDGNVISTRWLRWLGFEPTRQLTNVGRDKKSFTEYCLFQTPQVRDIYVNRNWRYFTDIES